MLRVVAVVAALSVGACSSDNFYEQAGGILGGAAGILLGSQVGDGIGRRVAMATGAGFGALLGRELGREMDDAARERATRAQEVALDGPDNSEVIWRDPDSGAKGRVRSQRADVRGDSGESWDCKTFTHEIEIEGETEVVDGLACRQPDGSWKVVA